MAPYAPRWGTYPTLIGRGEGEGEGLGVTVTVTVTSGMGTDSVSTRVAAACAAVTVLPDVLPAVLPDVLCDVLWAGATAARKGPAAGGNVRRTVGRGFTCMVRAAGAAAVPVARAGSKQAMNRAESTADRTTTVKAPRVIACMVTPNGKGTSGAGTPRGGNAAGA
ncbi:hypothetical protein GCM10023074_71880 [Microbispora amethystogenes]|uniref:Uncharacterized protein n=1 Tax=Microbispora amethystogenes TaxID=1427754 RepID=A0ABQ4FQ28_9ACTN|nr:hypothetical protein Mam01_70910 [Microbispora amethystogenes]